MANKKPLVESTAGQTQLIQTNDYLNADGLVSSNVLTSIFGGSANQIHFQPGASDATQYHRFNGSAWQAFGTNPALFFYGDASSFSPGQMFFYAQAEGTPFATLAPSYAFGMIWDVRDTGNGHEFRVAGNVINRTNNLRSQLYRPLSLNPQAAPASPINGDIWYDSTLGKFRKYEGGAASDLGAVAASGTVTSIPDGSTGGVSWTVATRTTTPTFTFQLGDIQPTSVNIDGNMAITNSGLFTRFNAAGAFDTYTFGWTSANDWLVVSANNVTRATSPSAGANNTELATMANVRAAGSFAVYRTVLDSSGSHTAARVAGTYWLGQSQPVGISGTGTLYPPNTIYIDSADYPSVDGLSPKLRIRGQVYVNDVAPTGNYTLGLFPITRPATSGGAGLDIYTLGTVVTGSNGGAVSAPAADSMNVLVGSDFALPANGHYVIGLVTTATVAVSSHVHISASLQMRYA